MKTTFAIVLLGRGIMPCYGTAAAFLTVQKSTPIFSSSPQCEGVKPATSTTTTSTSIAMSGLVPFSFNGNNSNPQRGRGEYDYDNDNDRGRQSNSNYRSENYYGRRNDNQNQNRRYNYGYGGRQDNGNYNRRGRQFGDGVYANNNRVYENNNKVYDTGYYDNAYDYDQFSKRDSYRGIMNGYYGQGYGVVNRPANSGGYYGKGPSEDFRSGGNGRGGNNGMKQNYTPRARDIFQKRQNRDAFGRFGMDGRESPYAYSGNFGLGSSEDFRRLPGGRGNDRMQDYFTPREREVKQQQQNRQMFGRRQGGRYNGGQGQGYDYGTGRRRSEGNGYSGGERLQVYDDYDNNFGDYEREERRYDDDYPMYNDYYLSRGVGRGSGGGMGRYGGSLKRLLGGDP